MGERTPDLEQRIDAIARELTALARRVATLEDRAATTPTSAASPQIPAAVPSLAGAPEAMASQPGTSWVSLVGRTLIALGGAYLLRAIHDAGVLPAPAAAGTGLAYAAWWLLMSDRAGARQDRSGAVFHGLTACLVGFPLILETAARFGTITVPVAAALLVGLHAAAAFVAWRQDLLPLAWLATLFGVTTAMALLLATHQLLPLALALLASCGVVELLRVREGWVGLRWAPALAADAVVLLVAALLARPEGLPDGYAPVPVPLGLAVVLALPLLYLTSVALRTLVYDRLLTSFAMLQSPVALLVGLGGAQWILSDTADGAALLHLGVLLIGGACYAIGFSWIDRRGGRGRNFYYYANLGLLLVLAGSRGLLAGARLAPLWMLLAVTLEWLGLRFDRRTLRVQGVAVWTAAAVASDLLRASLDGLTAAAARPWRDLSLVAVAVAIAGGLCYFLMLRARAGDDTWWETAPRTLLLALLAVTSAGLLARGLSAGLAAAAGPDPGVLATLRTAVLAAAAIGAAAAQRRWAVPELRWLVYPFLVAGGLKLLAEDLPQGRPATLFLSLALYGGALVRVAGRSPRS